MLTLALDTCDARGSIAVLNDDATIALLSHPFEEEYSSWLLPATDRLLASSNVSHSDLAGYAVASGPGSFTGVRVGLTTAKAWAEVYAKPVVPVSRLTVLAEQASKNAEYVAAFIDAQRKQIFAALYRREAQSLKLIGEEKVIEPLEFFASTVEDAGPAMVTWVSLDPEILTASPFWASRAGRGETILPVEPPLAPAMGLHARQAIVRHGGVDAFVLDANYVRRSDAEIFGKKAAAT
jgi:tRNA threonylcarbamoyladenosine biosynthesis protein TsaB